MTQSLKKKRIVAADDNRLFRIMLKDILEGAGYEVILASDGQEALNLTKRYAPDIDLIIVDLLMPRVTGFDVIKEIRRGAMGKDLPILAITEYYTNPSEIEKVRNTGATGYIRKSSGPEEILFRVNSILKPFPEERRSSTRIPVNLPITFECEGKTYACRTFNLGYDGCFVITRDLPKAGSLINLRFWLPHSSEIIKCRAQVTWLRDLEASEDDDLPPGVGVKFRDLDPDGMESLRQFVVSHLREAFSEVC